MIQNGNLILTHDWNNLRSAFLFLALVFAIVQLNVSLAESTATSKKKDNSSFRLEPQYHDQPSTTSKSGGRIVQSLFRFPASQLGPEFHGLLRLWYNEWLHIPPVHTNNNNNSTLSSTNLPPITPEPNGKLHATHSVTIPSTTLFRRQCYGPAPQISIQLRNLYKNLEQRRKEIEFQYLKDPIEEMKLLHTMVRRFYPAFLPEEEEVDSRVGASHGNGVSGAGGAKRIHKKKSRSTVNTIYASSTHPAGNDSPYKLSFPTVSSESSRENDTSNNQTQQWTWRPPGHFSSRGTPRNHLFRVNFFNAMRQEFQQRLKEQKLQFPGFNGLEMGRQSGMFWYPPGAVREWHSNYLDLVGNMKPGGGGRERGDDRKKKDEEIFASQVWRMYFVRVVRDSEFDEKLAKLRKSKGGANDTETMANWNVDTSPNDHSAMHIIPGEDRLGITLEVLRKAGARPLTKKEKLRQWSDVFAEEYSFPCGYNATTIENDAQVEKLDRNAVWRIPDQDGYVTLFRLPDLWHCIVSEEVHRYSLGFAFSDREAQALLRLAGVDFDVEGNYVEKVDKKDEL